MLRVWQSLRSQSPWGCAQLPSTEKWELRAQPAAQGASPAEAVVAMLSRRCRETWYILNQYVNLRMSRKHMVGRFNLWRLACQIYFEETLGLFSRSKPQNFSRIPRYFVG